jgi:hypothetical protein
MPKPSVITGLLSVLLIVGVAAVLLGILPTLARRRRDR